MFAVGMCGGALWNVSINDGKKGMFYTDIKT